MASLGFKDPRGAIVHGCVLRQTDRRRRFECDAEVDWSAVGDAALDAAGVVGLGGQAPGVSVGGACGDGWGFDKGVIMNRPGHFAAPKSRPYLEPFCCGDAQHGMG